MNHGAQNASIRHVGDLGNIIASAQGVANIDITDSIIKLSGSQSVLGRAFVVHAAVDDLGLGDNATSNATGNAGARVACGVIKQILFSNKSNSLFISHQLLIVAIVITIKTFLFQFK